MKLHNLNKINKKGMYKAQYAYFSLVCVNLV